jgi:hypothetical protein
MRAGNVTSGRTSASKQLPDGRYLYERLDAGTFQKPSAALVAHNAELSLEAARFTTPIVGDLAASRCLLVRHTLGRIRRRCDSIR